MAITIPQDLGQRLHDRATRGESLSTEERGQLQEWYTQNDQEEATHLSASPPRRDQAQLLSLVDHGTAQLVAEASRIQALTAENAQLRREIADLQKQLLEKRKAAPA